jgi:1-aminocyclopropane-1-carboxylate deaminase/D-cysteine desulfhydrase-like pyridoxal-dependent ACC family enzyme
MAGPTPLHRLDRAAHELGIDLWCKRDDLTGFAGGGNKARKLEFILPWLIDQGAQRVVCSGSLQSNFVRQMAAACAIQGIECHAVVMELPYDAPAGKPAAPPLGRGGNETLTRLFGAHIHLIPDGDWEDLEAAAEAKADELGAVVIPVGGSMPLGAWGFVLAAQELDQSFDQIIFASSSGSTHAGLAWELSGTPTRIIGIACDPEPDFPHHLAGLCAGLDEMTGQAKRLRAEDFDYRLDWVGPGYGVASVAGQSACEWLARKEGILLDPVYTSRAFAAVLGLAKAGELPGRTLFWHTGGWPALLASPAR